MIAVPRLLAIAWLALLLASLARAAHVEPTSPDDLEPALRRALTFLSREVPAWSAKHRCFSCHNNGDAARALYTARRLGIPLDDSILADTTRWLSRPAGWKDNVGSPEFSDEHLAALQFAAALVDATPTGAQHDPSGMQAAADLVVKSQQADGSWQIGAGNLVGSPTTYGPTLATAVARRVLVRIDAQRFSGPIAGADKWLRAAKPQATPDLAGVLLGLEDADDEPATQQRRRCLELIERNQSPRGGWGPFADHQPEAFDTAVVLLGLQTLDAEPQAASLIERGRRFLITAQLPDGSWRGTTRPANSDSYAQHLSTTGWATLALLATRDPQGAAPQGQRRDRRVP